MVRFYFSIDRKRCLYIKVWHLTSIIFKRSKVLIENISRPSSFITFVSRSFYASVEIVWILIDCQKFLTSFARFFIITFLSNVFVRFSSKRLFEKSAWKGIFLCKRAAVLKLDVQSQIWFLMHVYENILQIWVFAQTRMFGWYINIEWFMFSLQKYVWYRLQTIVNGIINLNAILRFARRLQTYPFEGNEKSSKDARN